MINDDSSAITQSLHLQPSYVVALVTTTNTLRLFKLNTVDGSSLKTKDLSTIYSNGAMSISSILADISN